MNFYERSNRTLVDLRNNNNFRYDINALRAIAIIGVVAYHYGIIGFTGGFVGVDIFFVISGFLISSHINRDLKENEFSFSAFYASRLRRIFPALAVMCIACSLWGWYYVLPKEYLVNARHELYALLFVSNYSFSNERGYFDAASTTKPLLHTWSLSVEGQFYLLLPLFLAAILRFSHQYKLIITSFVFLVSLACCLYYSRVDAGTAFYQLATRAWEFIAGTLLAMVVIKNNSVIFSNIRSIIGLSFLIISIGWFNSSLLWPSYYALLPVVGSMLLISSGEVLLTRRLFNSWLLQRLGDISYSLYLWHWPVWVFAKSYVNTRLDRELTQIEIVELIGLVVILAILSWRFVEKPTRLKSGWWSIKRLWQCALITLGLFISFTIANAVTKGLPNRLPVFLQHSLIEADTSTPRGECFRDSGAQKKAAEQFCQFGADNTQPSVLLWGDSHANMYLSAISKAAENVGVSGYIATQSGCRATLPDQYNDDLTGPAGIGCSQFNNEVNIFIKNNPSIHTVIIARIWSGGDSLNKTINLIKYLVKQEKNIIVVGPVPYLNFLVPEHWIYQQIKAGLPIDFLIDPIANQENLFNVQLIAQQKLSELISSRHVSWIDPLNRFCNNNKCLLVNNSVVYYKDMSHLSEAGAMLFTDDFSIAMTSFK